MNKFVNVNPFKINASALQFIFAVSPSFVHFITILNPNLTEIFITIRVKTNNRSTWRLMLIID